MACIYLRRSKRLKRKRITKHRIDICSTEEYLVSIHLDMIENYKNIYLV